MWNLALWSQAKAHAFPRQQLCQLRAPAIYMPLPSVFQGGSPALNPPNHSAGLQGNNSYNSYSYMPLPSVFQGVQDCRLPGLKPSKPLRRPPRQQLLQLLQLHALAMASNPPNPSAGLPRQQLLQPHAPAICFSGGSRLPFARPETLQTPPQASKATTLTATCPCHLFFKGFKTAVCPASNPPNPSAGLQSNNSYDSYSYMPLPSVFQGGSRLPFARPQTLQTPPQASKATTLTATCPCHLFFKGFKTAVCPASNPPNPSAGLQGNNSYSYMPLPSVFQGVCPASNPPNPSASLQGNNSYNSYSYMPLPSVFQGVQDCRLPGFKPSKPFRRPPRQQLLQLHAPAICFSGGFKTAVCPASNPPNPSAGLQGNNSYSYMPLPSVFHGVRDCRLPGLKPSKPSRRPPRQQLLQLLQLHAPAICFSGGFKTAVCPASNPPNPSAGLQGNNSYSYMPRHLFFRGVQDCRLPGFKPSKPLRRPPRQQLLQLLQLHAPAICFSGGSRLPFARPQTLQTPPQASKATTLTTLTATCPCHLFFRGFKTAVCPASNPPNPASSARPQTLQTPPQASKATTLTACPCHLFFRGSPGLKPSKPFRRPPRQQLLQLHAPAICF